MTIKTVLVDDDSNARKAARAMLEPYQEIAVIGEAENTQQLLELLKNTEVNLIFLDIELKKEHGFRTAELLQQQYPKVFYVFLTGHASYAIDGYDFHPAGFLTKPIRREKLSKIIRDVSCQMKHIRPDVTMPKVMFHSNSGYALVDVSTILYVERRNRKNYLVTSKGELRIYRYTLAEITDILAPYGFYCCHQSYVVSLSKIIAIKDEGKQLYYLELKGTDRHVPLSRIKYQECRQKLLELGIPIL